MLKRLLPSYAPFFIKDPDDQLMFELTVAEGAVDTTGEGAELGQFDCGGSNHGVYRLEDGYKIIIDTVDGRHASAMVTDADFSHCTVTLFGDERTREFGLGNSLMIAFAFAGAYHDIILLHASVTINDGRGYLFLGRSGTGKSTHSSLWRRYIPGSDLLNDDNPAVRLFPNGSVRVYGTPWSGKTPCYRNLSLPAGAVVRLEQYKDNVIRREPLIAAFGSLLSSCSTMIWDKPSYDHITRTVEGVVKTVPVFYLKCRADEEAARISYEAITPHKS